MRELFALAFLFILLGLLNYINLLPSYFDIELGRTFLIVGIIIVLIAGIMHG